MKVAIILAVATAAFAEIINNEVASPAPPNTKQYS